MNTGHRRVRIVVGNRELELEGDEEFVEEYRESIEVLLAALQVEPPGRKQSGGGDPTGKPIHLDGEFGEQFALLSNSANGNDQMLFAGRFAQASSGNQTFSTADANALLLEQGVKVANPAQAMVRNLKAKRVFKHDGGFRVSKPGEEHLATLIVSEQE